MADMLPGEALGAAALAAARAVRDVGGQPASRGEFPIVAPCFLGRAADLPHGVLGEALCVFSSVAVLGAEPVAALAATVEIFDRLVRARVVSPESAPACLVGAVSLGTRVTTDVFLDSSHVAIQLGSLYTITARKISQCESAVLCRVGVRLAGDFDALLDAMHSDFEKNADFLTYFADVHLKKMK